MFNLKRKLEEKKQPAAAGAAPAAPDTKAVAASDLILRKDIAKIDFPESLVKLEFPSADDLRHFTVILKPNEGIWAGGVFKFSFEIPSDYNISPPKVKCISKVLHPNIDPQGGVCLNILRDDWSPSLDLQAVLLGLLHLFYFPNPDDPLDYGAAELFKNDPEGFARRVKLMIHGRMYY